MQPHSGILHSHEKEGVPRAAAVRVTPEDAMLSKGSQSLQDTRVGSQPWQTRRGEVEERLRGAAARGAGPAAEWT